MIFQLEKTYRQNNFLLDCYNILYEITDEWVWCIIYRELRFNRVRVNIYINLWYCPTEVSTEEVIIQLWKCWIEYLASMVCLFMNVVRCYFSWDHLCRIASWMVHSIYLKNQSNVLKLYSKFNFRMFLISVIFFILLFEYWFGCFFLELFWWMLFNLVLASCSPCFIFKHVLYL